jgi:Na+-driven multidrug efflux pump
MDDPLVRSDPPAPSPTITDDVVASPTIADDAVAADSSRIDEEAMRLGSRSPARTVMILSVGPLICQMVQALYGVTDTLWVSRTIGPLGVAVYGAVIVIEFIAVSISNYLMAGLSARLSYLFGEGRGHECGQMYVDYLRIALLLGIIVPCCVLPATKPLIKWFGADDHLADMCLQYMFPISVLCFLNFLFTMGCGVLQAEGRALFYSITQIGSLVANMAVFDPLFLVAFKLPMWGASLATIISEGIPGIILTVLICSGKLSLVTNAKMFISKPSRETCEALQLGLSSLAAQLAGTFPILLMQKYVNLAATSIGEYETVIAVWAVTEKLYLLIGGACIGFSFGLLPGAALAYGANRLNRVFWLAVHALWIATALSTALSVILIFAPGTVAKLWSSDPNFIRWCKKMIPIPVYTVPAIGFQYLAPVLLQAMQRVRASVILSTFTMLISVPIFATILYFTGKDDPSRVLWSSAINDGWTIIMGSVFLIKPIKEMLSVPKDEDLVLVEGRNVHALVEGREADDQDKSEMAELVISDHEV